MTDRAMALVCRWYALTGISWPRNSDKVQLNDRVDGGACSHFRDL